MGKRRVLSMSDRTIQQTLHGYAGGHRLLAASVDLPAHAQEVLAALSDLSGPRPHQGFESYLTTYPLGGTDFIVFARTWNAPEMSRPGCVWTHSLLVPTAVLGTVPDLSVLTQLHLRPNREIGGTSSTRASRQIANLGPEYSRPIEIRSTAVAPLQRVAEDDQQLAYAVMRGLYGEAAPNPVVVLAANSHAAEGVVLALWSQQWPQLRASFLFCTGALAPRSIDGHPFDLQVMPPSVAARGFTHDTVSGVLVIDQDVQLWVHEFPSDSTESTHVSWIEAALADLYHPNLAFRRWVALAGREVGASREFASFSLSVAGDLTQEPPRIDAALRRIERECRGKSACERLKLSILGPQSLLRERDVLIALATGGVAATVDVGVLQIAERAKRLWLRSPQEGREILAAVVGAQPSEHSHQMLLGMAQVMGVDELVRTTLTHRGILYSAIVNQPALLTNAELWRTTATASEAVAALTALPEEQRPDADHILQVVIDGPHEIADQLARVYQGALLRALLRDVDLARRSEESLARVIVSEPWQRLIADHGEMLRDWLTKRHPSVILAKAVAIVASPADLSVIPLAHWIRILPDLASSDDVMLFATLFAVAMSFDNREAGLLAGRTFPLVHEMTKRSALPERAWNAIARRLPQVPKWMEWDRCERLRRGLVDAFIGKGPWQFVDFVAAFERDAAAFEAACAYARGSERGRSFLRRLAQAIQDGRISPSPSHRSIVEEYARKRLADYLSFD
jgi:hypothetical protein